MKSGKQACLPQPLSVSDQALHHRPANQGACPGHEDPLWSERTGNVGRMPTTGVLRRETPARSALNFRPNDEYCNTLVEVLL